MGEKAMNMGEDPKKPRNVIQFHIRHATVISILLLFFVASYLIQLFFHHQSVLVQEEKLTERHFVEKAHYIDHVLKEVATSLKAMQQVAEFDLLQSAFADEVKMPPVFQSIRNKSAYFTMDAPAYHISKKKIGNLTGNGSILKRDKNFYREIRAALLLSPIFQSARDAIKTAAWVYYISARDFIYLYPWIASSEWKFTISSYKKEFFLLGLPENDPEKKMFWTSVYLDEVGIGYMVTAGIPVYDGDRFLGVVAMDLTVDFLTQIVKEFHYGQGNMFLVNQQDQLLAHPVLTASKGSAIKTLEDAAPGSREKIHQILQQMPERKLVHFQDHIALKASLVNAPWTVIYIEPQESLFASFQKHIGISSLLLLLGLILLFIIVLLISQLYFVIPSEKFVKYILKRSNEEDCTFQNDVPGMWKQWFAVVEHTFNEKKRLEKEIREYNLELENRVHQRTSQLEEVNQELRNERDKTANIINSTPAMICGIDAKGSIQFMNPEGERITGYQIFEIKGKNWLTVCFPREIEKQNKQLIQSVGRHDVRDYHLEMTTKTGEKRIISWNMLNRVNAEGKYTGAIGFGQDITERRNAEEERERVWRLLDAAITQSPSGILVADAPDVTIRIANPAAMGIRGEARQQLVEIDVTRHAAAWQTYRLDGTVYPSEELPLSRAILEGVTTQNEDVIIRDENGVDHWVSTNASPVYDSNGNITAGIVIFHDITERKLAELALMESEKRYRLIFDKTPLGILHYDKNGTILDCNHKFLMITGRTKKSLMGFQMPDAMPDGQARDAVLQALRSGKGYYEGPCSSGWGNNDIVIRAIHKRIDSDSGEITGGIGIIEEIDEKKRLEEQLHQAQKMKAIGTLAGGIAHDFNNLLMGIQGNVSLILLDFEGSTHQFDKLKNIENYTKKAVELTNQLLGLARGGKYEIKPANLNHLVKSCSEMFGRTKKEIIIHHTLEKEIWTVEVDKGQIEQVLLNLFVNAWQAMPDGGKMFLKTGNRVLSEEFVKPYHLAPGRYVEISVGDTGIGMDAKTQKRIFDPFFTTKEMNRGTGLGLASSYGIIQNHEGIITVASEPGKGSVFCIYLPAVEKDIGTREKETEEIIKGSGNILFVDDEEMILEVGKTLIEKLGYQVTAVKSGAEAISIYQTMGSEIDLVILDIIMPVMGGEEIYQKLKAMNPKVKVLLSSGYSIDGKASEILKKGCNGFIQKPFNHIQLSRKIFEILKD